MALKFDERVFLRMGWDCIMQHDTAWHSMTLVIETYCSPLANDVMSANISPILRYIGASRTNNGD